jgi:uncharacterized repeat protein (TIGR03803 family)
LVILVFCAATRIASHAQTFKTLTSFDITNGYFPTGGSLVQGLDGEFYGTTGFGGAYRAGTVYKISSTGRLTTIHRFCSKAHCTDGAFPYAGLVLATDRNFYGTTYLGGSNCIPWEGCGVIFKINPQGVLRTVYSFCSQFNCTDGADPYAGVVQADNGKLYGTTPSAGANTSCISGCGTIFEITTAGKLTTLYSFCSQANCADGYASATPLVQANNGKLYGTTPLGGINCVPNGCGTVFEITPAGNLTTLYRFCLEANCTDGKLPAAGLVQGINGNLYGTTNIGGANNSGTVFGITPKGVLTTLYSFCSQPNCADGENPNAGLFQATDGNFYGTTQFGGVYGGGTVFEITSNGVLTTLYNFCSQPSCTDGEYPIAGLIQATDGIFYGTTLNGGATPCTYGCGTVFSLSIGLRPFVKTLPISGKVGREVAILGNNLTSATSVTFNGAVTGFKVLSNNEITTTVPAGATTGAVKVTTPSGILKSNIAFRVVR